MGREEQPNFLRRRVDPLQGDPGLDREGVIFRVRFHHLVEPFQGKDDTLRIGHAGRGEPGASPPSGDGNTDLRTELSDFGDLLFRRGFDNGLGGLDVCLQGIFVVPVRLKARRIHQYSVGPYDIGGSLQPILVYRHRSTSSNRNTIRSIPQ
jgi:hypothetical protein